MKSFLFLLLTLIPLQGAERATSSQPSSRNVSQCSVISLCDSVLETHAHRWGLPDKMKKVGKECSIHFSVRSIARLAVDGSPLNLEVRGLREILSRNTTVSRLSNGRKNPVTSTLLHFSPQMSLREPHVDVQLAKGDK